MLGLEPLIASWCPLIRVAGVQGLAHPGQHLVVEVEAAEQLGELSLKRLLAHILAAAGGRLPWHLSA